MPPDSGLAFVVVLHLAAGRKSMLPEILARWTAMPVAEAQDGIAVVANHVLVIPAGTVAELHDGQLWLREIVPGCAAQSAPDRRVFRLAGGQPGRGCHRHHIVRHWP